VIAGAEIVDQSNHRRERSNAPAFEPWQRATLSGQPRRRDFE
jgi:hypothetical protein